MPCSAIALACSAASRTPSRPPCTIGCRVFTRPSIISGKPVRSETSFTAVPAPSIAARVPPVETSSTPAAASAWAASIRPVLSETEISARLGTTRSGAGGKFGAAGTAQSPSKGSKENAQASGVMRSRAPRWSPTLDFASHTERRRLRPRAGRGQCGRGRSSGRSSLAQWGRGPALELILPSWGRWIAANAARRRGTALTQQPQSPLSQLR